MVHMSIGSVSFRLMVSAYSVKRINAFGQELYTLRRNFVKNSDKTAYHITQSPHSTRIMPLEPESLLKPYVT